jgi:arylsulfatase
MLKHYDEWGSPSTYPHMAAGWAVALDSPFEWTKVVASDFGGTRNGMVICWPEGIEAKGEIRSQFGHVIDIAPTVYEIANIPAPKVVNGIVQDPIEGTSLVYSFNDAGAKEKHTTQYFEIFGNRAIYNDGWFARTIHRPPWMSKPLRTLQEDKWELYNTYEDFSLSRDLSSKYPERLKAMQDLFMQEGERYHVLPIDDRVFERFIAAAVGRPTVLGDRTTLTLGEGMKGMGPDIFINLMNKSYTITADVEVADKTDGVILCQGGRFGGIAFYMKDSKPCFTYNYLGLQQFNVTSAQSLKPGNYTLVFDFVYDGGGPGKGGVGTILVNGSKVAESRIEITHGSIFSGDDMADIGTDEGTPVTDYGSSAEFTGKIEKVFIETK